MGCRAYRIRRREMNFKQWHEENKHSIYNDPVGAMEQAFNAGQQQYKSLVKTVDADNLPFGRDIYAWCGDELYLGSLNVDLDDDDDEQLVLITLSDKHINPTHYIEQKDLIKMMSGV